MAVEEEGWRNFTTTAEAIFRAATALMSRLFAVKGCLSPDESWKRSLLRS